MWGPCVLFMNVGGFSSDDEMLVVVSPAQWWQPVDLTASTIILPALLATPPHCTAQEIRFKHGWSRFNVLYAIGAIEIFSSGLKYFLLE